MTAMKKVSLLIFIGILLFVTEGCSGKGPEIKASITLSDITNDEYSQIGDSNMPADATISDLRKLNINVKISKSKTAVSRTITIPDLYVIDKYDGIRSVQSGRFEENNIRQDDTAETIAYIIFDRRGLSDQEIKNIYSKSEIYIAYELKDNNSQILVEENIFIGDGLEIE
jgi:hypothetical protein